VDILWQAWIRGHKTVQSLTITSRRFHIYVNCQYIEEFANFKSFTYIAENQGYYWMNILRLTGGTKHKFSNDFHLIFKRILAKVSFETLYWVHPLLTRMMFKFCFFDLSLHNCLRWVALAGKSDFWQILYHKRFFLILLINYWRKITLFSIYRYYWSDHTLDHFSIKCYQLRLIESLTQWHVTKRQFGISLMSKFPTRVNFLRGRKRTRDTIMCRRSDGEECL